MFDGNHRSRRNVSLNNNGRSKRRSTGTLQNNSKASLLEKTRILREQRRISNLKIKSAKIIQTNYRGYKQRKQVFTTILCPRWKDTMTNSTTTTNSSTTTTTSRNRSTRHWQEQNLLLSLLLSSPFQHNLHHQNQNNNNNNNNNNSSMNKETLLLQHGKTIRNMINHNNNTTTPTPAASSSASIDMDMDVQTSSSMDTDVPTPSSSICASARIVQAILSRFHPNNTKVSTKTASSSTSSSTTDDHHQLVSLYKTILQFYLTTQTTEAIEQQQQHHQQQGTQQRTRLVKRLGGMIGCFKLIKCTQKWLWYNNNNNINNVSNNNNNITMVANMLLQWTYTVLPNIPNNKAIMGAMLLGKEGLLQINDKNNNNNNNRLLLFNSNSNNNDNDEHHFIQDCFKALVKVIISHHNNDNNNSKDNTKPVLSPQEQRQRQQNHNDDVHFDIHNTIMQTVKNRDIIILQNALHLIQNNAKKNNQKQLPPFSSTLQYINYLLATKNDLAILTSLVVHGENIHSILTGAKPTLEDHDEDEDDYDDDDDISDNEREDNQMTDLQNAARLPSSNSNNNSTTPNQNDSNKSTGKPYNKNTHRRNNNKRLTKQDLQTITKLDKLYQDQIQKWKQQSLSLLQKRDTKYQKAIAQVAIQIGNASTWQKWVEHDTQNNNNSDGVIDNDDDDLDDDPFIPFLWHVLHGVTGVKPSMSAKSRFLAQLAFGHKTSKTVITKLWTTLQKRIKAANKQKIATSMDEKTCMCMIVFCDIFVHSLIATTDKIFLDKYTNITSATTTTNEQPVLMAEDLIIHLKSMLHELYWTKPVIVADIEMAAASPWTTKTTTTVTLGDDTRLRALRGRLILSGTKCWNSLYERWCRLVRHTPFTDQSTWWFPHIVSRDNDSAVVNIYENNNDMEESPSESRRRRSFDHNTIESMDIDTDSDDDNNDNNNINNNNSQHIAVDAENDALANSFRDPKMARILTSIPQALPFDRRVRLFHSLLSADKMKTQDEASDFRMAMLMMMRGMENEDDPGNALERAALNGGREQVEIRRDRLYEDSMEQLNQLGTRLKKKVQVTFINQHGSQEPGIDGGGVFKEFVDDLISDAFKIQSKNNNKNNNKNDHDNDNNDNKRSSSPALFSVTPLQTLTINTSLLASSANDVAAQQKVLSHYEFLGRVLGKAVYESILVEPQFCLPFLNQLLGKRNSLEDLKNFDVEYYQNLIKLLSLKGDEIDNLGLSFELTIDDTTSNNNNNNKKRFVELIPGGRNLNVTKQNVIQYIYLIANRRLNKEGAIETKAFLQGFRDLIPASWVRLFSSNELQKLISGDDSIRGIDVPSLQKIIQYSAGYHPSQPVIQWLWEIVDKEFTPKQQRQFLKFITSCSRQPLLGFQSLDPTPCVQQIRIDTNTNNDRIPLPTSSTCMNLFKLPNYPTKDILRKKLLDAVESGAGFELT